MLLTEIKKRVLTFSMVDWNPLRQYTENKFYFGIGHLEFVYQLQQSTVSIVKHVWKWFRISYSSW